ncbi:MAG: tRNA 2-thiouridine(34) synthase MnmA [Candidatus Eisenbacteria bacterium]|nr:tRNA 2-thiouridine(34) synthase MnmA [Candidatus Eisenbacteria bacterium]
MSGESENRMPGAGERVAVALSGGVDSSAAAWLLREAGCRTVAFTIRHLCGAEGEGGPEEDSLGGAARVAEALGIPHHVLDAREIFRDEVMEPFRREYLAGRTPNPCVVCNRSIKFGVLLREVLDGGFDRLATGHHARLAGPEGGLRIRRAADLSKDQSYVLWAIGAAALPRLAFPVGGLAKAEVRRIAAAAGLPAVDRPESQDVCFLGTGDLPGFLGEPRPGPIMDGAGTRIGTHRGAACYTIGQRKGLGVAAGEPLYVVETDTRLNVIRLGREEELFASAAILGDENFHAPEEEALRGEVLVKIRYRHEPSAALLRRDDRGRLRVLFHKPQRAVTPGQSAVFYRGDTLLGGAVIDAALRS